ncbi:hypothetical protein Tco_1254059 [Tanacetum coccineum]
MGQSDWTVGNQWAVNVVGAKGKIKAKNGLKTPHVYKEKGCCLYNKLRIGVHFKQSYCLASRDSDAEIDEKSWKHITVSWQKIQEVLNADSALR